MKIWYKDSAPPVAAFTASTTSGVTPLSVTFTDQSTNAPTSWSWNFGDGSANSTSQNPTHSYATPGTYTVTLIATNALGSDSETKTNYITVTVPPPVAAFTATPTVGQIPLSVTFTDQSTGSPTSWSWDFGDGETSTAQNPSHSFAGIGTYTVTLTATNAGGSDAEVKTGYITVNPPPSSAAFTNATPTSGVAPLTVTFTDQSTNTPTSWAWDFDNDGDTDSTEQNPQYTYTTPGTYTVELTASNAGGGSTATMTDFVTVTPPPPVAAFSMAPTSGEIPLSVIFTDESTSFPASWSWDFGDGGTSTTQSPSHTYTSTGTFTVTLTVTNAGGTDSETKTGAITVTIPRPVAAFSGTPVSGEVPLTVSFTDASTNTPVEWQWDFGDGNSVTLYADGDVAHEYQQQGTYDVTLTVTNAGGSDSETKIRYITVGNPSEAVVFITDAHADRAEVRRGDKVNVSIRLIAGEATPLDGMILLDKGGDSMNGFMADGLRRWDYAKEGARYLVGNVSDKSGMGISTFATRGGEDWHTVDNGLAQWQGEIDDLPALAEWNGGVVEEGGIVGMSNLRDGLYQTIKYLGEDVQQQDMRTRAIIVFTDGLYNYYGSPLAHGRGYALRTKIAQVQWINGLGYVEANNWTNEPYDPRNVETYVDDEMWWENSAMEESGLDRPTCWFPTYDYTFYNWIQENRVNGGWTNFTGNYWNGMAALGDGAHITYPTFTGVPSQLGRWHLRYGETQCMFPGGWGHCDEITEVQYHLDVSDSDFPYIDASGIERGSSEQTEQNMTIFARDYNIRLYTVSIHLYPEADTGMPSSIVTTDDMMKVLAYQTGGKYYPVNNRQALYDAMDDIARDLSAAATTDLTMELETTAVDVDSIEQDNMDDSAFAHEHIDSVSSTTRSWDQYGATIEDLATIPEGDDWGDTHQLSYFIDDLEVGDSFQLNYTVNVSARGDVVYLLGDDSKVTNKNGEEIIIYPRPYVEVVNSPPVIDEIDPWTIQRTENVTFTVSATDADGDELYYGTGITCDYDEATGLPKTTGLPEGAIFDTDTHEFEWMTVPKDPPYPYLVTFWVDDRQSDGCVTEPVTITVSPDASILVR